jgi:hypothetical protein
MRAFSGVAGLLCLLSLAPMSAGLAQGVDSGDAANDHPRGVHADRSDTSYGWGRFKCKTDVCKKKHPSGYWQHSLTARRRHRL